MAGVAPPPVSAAQVDEAILANGSSGRELEADGDGTVFGPLATASTTPICALEVTVGARPVAVVFDLPAVYDDDPCSIIMQLTDEAQTVIAGRCVSAPGGGILAGSSGTLTKVFRVPGTYSLLGQVYASTGTPTIGYDASTEATLRAIEQ